jgi:hypothetical protein
MFIDDGLQQGGKLPVPGILNDVIRCRCPGKSVVVCEHYLHTESEGSLTPLLQAEGPMPLLEELKRLEEISLQYEFCYSVDSLSFGCIHQGLLELVVALELASKMHLRRGQDPRS